MSADEEVEALLRQEFGVDAQVDDDFWGHTTMRLARCLRVVSLKVSYKDLILQV
jgi:hypothetical protein